MSFLNMKNFIKEYIPYLIIIVAVILIRTYIVTPVRVEGKSMYPTLDNKQILLLKKYDKSYKRFDIVVLKYNDDRLIKRVIGLPGETIKYENNKLYINGKYIKENFKRNTDTKDFNYYKIPEDSYFVMGDNRGNSTDSRIIGPVSKNNITGTIGISLFPFNRIGKIK